MSPDAERAARCELCSNEDGEDVQSYTLPVHNGVYPSPASSSLCDPCAYLIAEELADFASKLRHAAGGSS